MTSLPRLCIACINFAQFLPFVINPCLADKLGYLRFWEGVPGVGYKMSQQLEALQLRTAADLRKVRNSAALVVVKIDCKI